MDVPTAVCARLAAELFQEEARWATTGLGLVSRWFFSGEEPCLVAERFPAAVFAQTRNPPARLECGTSNEAAGASRSTIVESP